MPLAEIEKSDRELRYVELDLRRLELAGRLVDRGAEPRWLSSPLLLSVVAAVLGFIATAYLNNQTAQANRDLERDKAEVALILHAVQGGDSLQRAENLRFFLDAGFIRDRSGSIRSAVEKTIPAGEASSVPEISSTSISPTEAPTQRRPIRPEVVASEVRAIIARQFHIPKSRLQTDTTFDALGADDLDIIQLTMVLDNRFMLSIPDEDRERFRSVKDVIDYVTARVSGRK